MTLDMKGEECKMTCNKSSKESNDIIVVDDIGKINDIVEQVSFEKEYNN